MTTNEVLPSYSENQVDAIITFDKIKIKLKNWEGIKQEDLKIVV